MKTALALMTLASPLLHAESFESLPPGPLKSAKTAIGTWAAESGHAQVQPGHAKTGQQSLRLSGDGERSATLTLTEPAAKGSALTFSAERWTKRDPFRFRIEAKERGTWKELTNADDIPTGDFKGSVRIQLPTGASELRFRVTAPADAGVLMDDFILHRPGPARAVLVETVQPVCPAFIREDFNPVLGFRIVVEGLSLIHI